MVEVVVIGAGPYGLSVAAHLRQRRVPFRIFGKTMSMWRDHTPIGMTLKSDGFASNLSAPGEGYTLERFFHDVGRTDYAHIGFRVRAETLTEYGQAFQRRCVGEVDEAEVVDIARAGKDFTLTLDTGEQVSARKVVVATGLLSLRHVPDDFACLPSDMVTHSSAHHDLSGFQGRRVVVVGAGQSACEISALLNEQGAEVTMLTRRPLKWFNPALEDDPTARRTNWQRLRRPNWGLGPGWRTWFWSEMPYGYSFLPQEMRHTRAFGMFAPAGSGWIKHRVDGVIPIHTGTLRHLEERGGEARFSVDTATGPVELAADHVVAATGYKGDTRRLPFLRGLEGELRTIGAGVPVLNRAFETSIPGLYIAGFLSAATFGPSMRFIYGAAFAGRQISRHTAHLAAGKRRSGRISFSPAVRADASL